MNPTQSNAFHHRWFHHPDVDYSFSHRFRWPAPPTEGATGASANTAAESTAAGFASSGGARPPPRGYGGYHHYYERGPYRRWGRRPSRFVWFSIGAITATVWYKHHLEHQKHLEKFITDPQCWTRHPHTAPPSETLSTAPTTPAVPSATPSGTDSLAKRDSSWWWDDEKRHAGWRAWKEQKMEERRARHEAKADPTPAPVDTTAPASSEETIEFKSLREAVEKLWAEKAAANEDVQKVNDQAREYASEKLEKLGAALEKLRESLKVDEKPQGSKKLV
ncbi:hypothetical protein IAR50_001823 [Cryptococcus sp. DSM 104548]